MSRRIQNTGDNVPHFFSWSSGRCNRARRKINVLAQKGKRAPARTKVRFAEKIMHGKLYDLGWDEVYTLLADAVLDAPSEKVLYRVLTNMLTLAESRIDWINRESKWSRDRKMELEDDLTEYKTFRDLLREATSKAADYNALAHELDISSGARYGHKYIICAIACQLLAAYRDQRASYFYSAALIVKGHTTDWYYHGAFNYDVVERFEKLGEKMRLKWPQVTPKRD